MPVAAAIRIEKVVGTATWRRVGCELKLKRGFIPLRLRNGQLGTFYFVLSTMPRVLAAGTLNNLDDAEVLILLGNMLVHGASPHQHALSPLRFLSRILETGISNNLDDAEVFIF